MNWCRNLAVCVKNCKCFLCNISGLLKFAWVFLLTIIDRPTVYLFHRTWLLACITYSWDGSVASYEEVTFFCYIIFISSCCLFFLNYLLYTPHTHLLLRLCPRESQKLFDKLLYCALNIQCFLSLYVVVFHFVDIISWNRFFFLLIVSVSFKIRTSHKGRH